MTEKLPYTVRGLRLEADGVLSVELVPADGVTHVEWAPGAHVDLTVGDGTTRQYSLCGRPSENSLRIATLRQEGGRGGSRWVHDELRPGQTVMLGGPRNHFAFSEARSYVFIAGGVGITPILPMLEHADEIGAEWQLHYFGRSRRTMAFLDRIKRHSERVHLYPGDEDARPEASDLVATLGPEALVYACGPERLLASVTETMVAHGAEERLRTELFSAPDADENAPEPGSFDVELADSGMRLHVPADRSVLSVLAENGVDVVSDCEEGICGSCETRVLGGEIDHRDHILTTQEREAGDCMMVCVSRANCPVLTLAL